MFHRSYTVQYKTRGILYGTYLRLVNREFNISIHSRLLIYITLVATWAWTYAIGSTATARYCTLLYTEHMS